MEARLLRAALAVSLIALFAGAKHRTANFIVETADPRLAVQLAEAAERYRHDLAIDWLGKELPNWSQPCPMTVRVGSNLGAGGATKFMFDRGEVFGWKMSIQGSAERLLDSVIPHEVTHMIFASHFRQPLPRWADEGGATSVEHQSERDKQRKLLYEFLQTNRGIAFNKMFAMKEYPQDILPLYAQGYSLAEYFIQVGGRREYVAFVGDGLETGNWAAAVRNHYKINDLGTLQTTWLAWVRDGSPPLKPSNATPLQAAPVQLASAAAPRPSVYANVTQAPPQTAMQPAAPHHAPQQAPQQATLQPLPFDRPAPATASASGWHSAGNTPAPPAPNAEPYSTVARPQPFEQPRQVILEWSRP